MLTTSELAQMRADIEALLPDTCNILTATLSSDGQGGMVQAWGTASANVKCRLDPGRKEMGERVTAGALMPYSYWYLTLPYDTTITTNSRVEHDGQAYNVIGIDDGKSWQASVRVTVVKA